MENVHIVVEDTDLGGARRRAGIRGGSFLLGLYEGVPLTRRGTGYGMYPILPDKITLFKQNIERVARTPEEIRLQIREVLIHEIAHHFGMDEKQIRDAGY